ncbi:helix-turn-helix domain-containing protein [Nocardia sp. NPDC005978]|uniref:TetR/AcrR family transcriptional regulator n=1 Tax=unclassified Nocardia TaxID=2637762 RepID=UPI0033AF3A1E
MARPRTYDPDAVLDAAETLAATAGPAAVTIRAVAAATGMSNGALYHSFGSRAELCARTWIRAGERFGQVQRELVDAHPGDPVRAVIAAAGAPAVFAERFPDSCRLLLGTRRAELLGTDTVPEPLTARMHALERALIELFKELSTALWDRRDARAVDTLTICLVDLPTAILLERDRLADPHARAQLAAAVRAVLAVGPADPDHRTR